MATRVLGVCFVHAILPHWKYLEHKLLATLLNRSAHVGAAFHTLALDWLEALVPHADLIASKQRSFSLWQLNSLDIFQKIKIHYSKLMSIFSFFLFTIVMLFVRELLDVNIKKEMSEEVMDLEANVSNIFSLNLNMGAIQEDRMT